MTNAAGGDVGVSPEKIKDLPALTKALGRRSTRRASSSRPAPASSRAWRRPTRARSSSWSRSARPDYDKIRDRRPAAGRHACSARRSATWRPPGRSPARCSAPSTPATKEDIDANPDTVAVGRHGRARRPAAAVRHDAARHGRPVRGHRPDGAGRQRRGDADLQHPAGPPASRSRPRWTSRRRTRPTARWPARSSPARWSPSGSATERWSRSPTARTAAGSTPRSPARCRRAPRSRWCPRWACCRRRQGHAEHGRRTARPTRTVDGRTFKNAHDEALGRVPFHATSRKSCNTAFVGLAPKLGADGLRSASTALGLGGAWDLGVEAFSGKVSHGGSPTELAAATFGQGATVVSPLAMAGATAAVARGRFEQPKLVLDPAPAEPRAPPARRSTATSLKPLRTMMREVVTNGHRHRAAERRGRAGVRQDRHRRVQQRVQADPRVVHRLAGRRRVRRDGAEGRGGRRGGRPDRRPLPAPPSINSRPPLSRPPLAAPLGRTLPRDLGVVVAFKRLTARFGPTTTPRSAEVVRGRAGRAAGRTASGDVHGLFRSGVERGPLHRQRETARLVPGRTSTPVAASPAEPPASPVPDRCSSRSRRAAIRSGRAGTVRTAARPATIVAVISCGVRAVRVVVRVEDGDLHAQAVRRVDQPGQQQLQLGEGDAARLGRVHRRHHRRVEHVDVDVHPVAGAVDQLVAGPLGAAGRALGAQRPAPARVTMPAACRSRRYSSLGADAQHAPRRRRGSTGRRPSIAARSACPRPVTSASASPAAAPTYGGVARVPEVGVTVHEDQPDPAADRLAEPVHGQRRSRARSSSRRPARPGTRRRRGSRRSGRPAGASTRAISAAWQTPSPGRQSPGSYRGGVRQPASRAREAGEQAVVAQGPGRLGAARHRRRGRRAQTEIGRRVEDGDAAHGPPAQKSALASARRAAATAGIVGAGHA